MGSHYCKQKAAEWNYNHGYYLRCYLSEKFFQVYQSKCRQNSRDYLCLIANHIYLNKPEIPFGNIRCSRGRYRIGIQKLPRYQRQSKNNSKHLGSTHLLCHRPADAHRKHMENGFANQPQKSVNTGPKLADIAEGLGAVLKQIQTVNTVAEA